MEEKRPVGRPSEYKPEYCQAIIDHMEEGASITSFAASISVARSSINEWMDRYPEFSEAVKIGKAKCAAWWEKAGRKSATEGGGSATLVIFGLTNMGADDWKQKQELDHKSSDGSMTPAPVGLPALYAALDEDKKD